MARPLEVWFTHKAMREPHNILGFFHLRSCGKGTALIRTRAVTKLRGQTNESNSKMITKYNQSNA